MKKFLSVFFLLCCVAAASADELKGKVITQTKSNTDIVAGQWYTVNSGGKYISDPGTGTLAVNTRAALSLATDAADMLVKFEAAEGGYFIHTANGYMGAPGTDEVPVTATPEAVYTVSHDGNGAYTLANNGRKPLISGDRLTATEGASTWSLFAVSLKAQGELTAEENKSFITRQLEKKKGFLVRVRNRRDGDRYLCALDGRFRRKPLTGATDKNFIWVIRPNGSGYEILNIQTQTFMGKDFDVPESAPTTLYIQCSPNTTAETYWNISSKEDFSGACLNGNSDDLFEWSYEGDEGSDWALEMVCEMDIDEIIDDILSQSPYARKPEEGKYYRLINGRAGQALMQNDDHVVCLEKNDNLFSQYWTLVKDGEGWNFRNVLTDQYIQPQSSFYTPFPMSAEPASLFITRTDDVWAYTWHIECTPGSGTGMHCDGSKNVVVWYHDSPANNWSLEEVTLTEEEILAAKNKESEFDNLTARIPELQAALDIIFTDKGATTLSDTYTAMTDEQLQADATFNTLNDELKALVLKIKNNTWAYRSEEKTEAVPDGNYERFFRINSYMPYSHHQKMSEDMKQSYWFARLSNPTGIALKAGEVAYIFVDDDAPAGATLQVEAVNVTPGNCGPNNNGQVTDLKKGLNMVRYTQDKMLFIFYQVDDIKRNLADFPDRNIHIEGGQVFGTFDLTRGMKNRDWDNMTALGLIQNFGVLNLKGSHLVMLMNRELSVKAIYDARAARGTDYTDVELLVNWWNNQIANEQRYQGLDAWEGRYRNVWNALSIDHAWFYASTYGSYYNNASLWEMMNYDLLTAKAGMLWGPSHEFGHCHQRAINCVGCTEVSNNMFSNINVFEAGTAQTNGFAPKVNFEHLAKKDFWLARDLNVTMRMYFQLYLYFHAQGADPQFLPKLFAALRKDPMTGTGQTKKVTHDGKDYDAWIVYGKDDYLKFAKKCCDAAQMDLSEFFESYGFFVPVEDFFVDDYAAYAITTRQADINAAKAYMRKYPRKGGNIMFINDFAVQHPANPDNIFSIVAADDGLKTANNDNVGGFGKEATTGDHMLYNQTEDYKVTGDYYTVSGSRITFKGKNFLGHKVYDLNGKLIWAVAKNAESIPASIKSLFPDQVKVVAVDRNMMDVPCHYYKKDSSPVYTTEVTFPSGTTNVWCINQNIDKYLPANAVAVVTDEAEANDEVLGSTNVVSKAGVARKLTIDGDLPMVIPADFTAESLTFTKKGTGYQALQLPFAVNATTIVDNERVNIGTVEAGNPVVVEGNVAYTLENVAVKTGSFQLKESGFALNAAGDAVEAASGLSPFTFCFDGPATITTATAINDILAQPEEAGTKVFDLSGRSVRNVKKGGLYIINGKKALVK